MWCIKTSNVRKKINILDASEEKIKIIIIITHQILLNLYLN